MRIAILTPPIPRAPRKDLEDTVVQAKEVVAALNRLGHEVLTATWQPNATRTQAALEKLQPEIVFNLVEDVAEGPDKVHLVTALLDRLRLHYTGASTMALEALGDKPRMKATLVEGGLPVAPDLIEGEAGARFIVKSSVEHSSVGLTEANVVTGRPAAEALIAEKQRDGSAWFAEVYVDGREFNISILETLHGPLALPAAEILFLDHQGDRPKIVGYEEKWESGSTSFANTPRVFPDDPADAPLLAELERLALSAWRIFALTGYARIDFRVDPSGQPFILEVNANPCLAADAGFCAAAEKAGMSETDVVSHLLAAAQD